MNLNKNLSLLSLMVAFSQLSNAQMPEKIAPFNTPFGNFQFKRPEFKDTSVNITAFGAKEGGTVKNTEAINNAIKQLAATGGGRVVVSKGKWLTGPIVLLSNINLHLEEGAELLFSQNFDDYLPAVLTNWEGSEVYSYSPFIYALHQENIAVTGKGILNGQGKPWWLQRKKPGFYESNNRLRDMNEKQVPVSERRFGSLEGYLPPVFFGPLYCKNILLEGVTFQYGAFWTINPSFCTNLIVRGITVLTNGEYGHTPNGDGINPNSCQDVLIEYNTLDTGDDCITIKSGRNKDGRRIGMSCKNILIRHNVGLQGHGGIVIGSEMSGGVENVYAHDCRFNGTDRIIRIKTDRGRGGYVKNCWFKNMSADTIEQEAIRINMLYSGGKRLPEQAVDEGTPVIENIYYENIRCDYAKKNVIQIIGIPEMPVKNISFKNIDMKGNQGIDIVDAKNITIDNITISNKTGLPAAIAYSDHITINKLTIAATAPEKLPIQIKDASHINIDQLSYRSGDKKIRITGSSENVQIGRGVRSKEIVRETNPTVQQ